MDYFNKELNSEHFILQLVCNGGDFNLGLNFCTQHYQTYETDYEFNVKVDGDVIKEYYILFSLLFVQVSIGFRLYFKNK